jgi:hypothetical protein
MARKKDPVHASYGTWSYTLDPDGELVECKGVFALRDKDHALGAARYFHKAYISNPDAASERNPEKYNDAYVVRLHRDAGDRLEKFQHWAEDHHLMPGLEKEQEHIVMIKELAEQEERALAFQPMAEKFAKDTINHMNWEMLEAYPSSKNADAHLALSTHTEHPQVAFQAALYLYKKDYMNADHFHRLNKEIKACMENQSQNTAHDMSFQIVVDGKHSERFMKEFPKAGLMKEALGPKRLKLIAELSEPKTANVEL